MVKLPACFNDAHNQRIMARRAVLAFATHLLDTTVNHAWRVRAWQTPDVAVCLGRFDRVAAPAAKRRRVA
jgi:hypothetical protein